jgi:hypothetical protein
MSKRSRRLVEDEADCPDEDSEEYLSEEDSAGSLIDFIDEEYEEAVEVENLVASGIGKKKISQQKAKTKLSNTTANKSKKSTKSAAAHEKLPGDITFPLNSFSLTITKTGGDIAVELLEILEAFLKQHCTKGI